MSFQICLIGCGGMAFDGHGPMLQRYAAQQPGVKLAACCDLSLERAQAFAAAFGFRQAYTDMERMLDDVRPDGAVLAVPIDRTAELAVDILRRHIPLLCEKPPGITPEQGAAIVAAARAASVPVSAAFNRRTMPLVEALTQQIAALGAPIDSLDIEMCRVDRRDPDFSMTAIHDIDLARYLCCSDYTQAQFAYRVHADAAPAADMAVLATMETGALVKLGFHPMCGALYERITMRLRGHVLRAELPIYGSADQPGRIVHTAGNREVAVIHGDGRLHPAEANGFLGEHLSFFDAVRRGVTPPHSVEGSLQSLHVACCLSRREASYRKS